MYKSEGQTIAVISSLCIIKTKRYCRQKRGDTRATTLYRCNRQE